MIGRLARAGLTALLVLSLALTGMAAVRVMQDPLVRPLIDAPLNEIAARSDRMMAQDATPGRITARLADLLAEAPRNWLAIQAVEGVAIERGVTLPEPVATARAVAWDADSGLFEQAGECAACVWDAGTCTLSNALMCNAPVSLSPVGDLLGLSRAGIAWATGTEVDQIDLALSIVGLGATATIVASGGTSLTLKLGAGTIRLARKMGMVSPRLSRLLSDVASQGIDWQRVTRMDFSEPTRLIRTDVVAPLANVASDLGRVGRILPATETLHLLRYVDDATDSRRLANAAEALGPKTGGRLEVLGKSRFMRATVRLSDLALQAVVGFIGVLLSLASLAGGMAQSWSLRLVRRLARSPAR